MSRIPLYLLVLTLLGGICVAAPLIVPVGNGPIGVANGLVDGKKLPEAVKALSDLLPGFPELGPYHFVYGRALAASGDLHEAARHYRLASVYGLDPALKETALFMAADAEFRAGFLFESKTICTIFLSKYPDSGRAGTVRVLLGRSLAGIGRGREAVRQFDLAGGSAEALYGKANTLQKTGMSIEAAKAYAAAAAADPGGRYLASSEESRCWKGENLRASGLNSRARELLRNVTAPECRDHAMYGLAEIEAAESNPQEALRLFASLVSSRDRGLARRSMLRASDIEASEGKIPEAAARLESIVDRYPFTAEYDQAVLRLARMRSGAGEQVEAMSMLSRLVLRPSTVRGEALDEMERVLLAARAKGPGVLADLWNAGGRWLMDPSREAALVQVAEALHGAERPYQEIVQWLSRFGSPPVRARHLAVLASRYAAAGDAVGLRLCLQGFRELDVKGDAAARAEAYLKLAEKDFRGAEKALLSLGRLEPGDFAMMEELLPHVDDPRKVAAAVEAEASRPGGNVSARLLSRLADRSFDAGRRDEAARYYRMAAEKDPGHEWSCYRLVVLLGKNGGGEYRKRIRKDPVLARMANAAWKEQELDGR
jgi:tetratricopeptide (TPR) repeat protein